MAEKLSSHQKNLKYLFRLNKNISTLLVVTQRWEMSFANVASKKHPNSISFGATGSIVYLPMNQSYFLLADKDFNKISLQIIHRLLRVMQVLWNGMYYGTLSTAHLGAVSRKKSAQKSDIV